MQSWGTNSHFESRYTDFYPSKSAVIGLIAASFGYRRDEDEKIQKLNELEFAVRIDQQGKLLRDYQIATKYKNGKFERNYVTNRYYLEDAIFIVAICGEDNLMNAIYHALKYPYFQQFLGRRSIPVNADFIMCLKDGTTMENLNTLPWQANDWYKKENKYQKIINLEVYGDSSAIDGDIEFRRDNVISFSQKNRKFTLRPQTRTKITFENNKSTSDNEEHDIFSEV